MARFRHDPYGFVLYAFPWGEGAMVDMQGPEQWAIELFEDIRQHLTGPNWNQPYQFSVASGHGITKSATLAQLILWAMATQQDAKGIITANTEQQLRTKTWPELTKWYHLFIGKRFFELTDTALFSKSVGHEKTWRFDRVTWSEHNTDAFQGLHNQGKRLTVFFDEGSNIADKVWEVTEGALTDRDTEILWGVFGNPTRNVGRFFECFHRYRHRWRTRMIDSRTVRVTNKQDIQRKLEDHGEDSDYFKVRVRGMFPARASNQFIDSQRVEDAAVREALATVDDPLVIGVDVARFGTDATVIRTRNGRDARTWKKVTLRGANSTQVASHVAKLVEMHERRGAIVDAIFVDGTGGYGGGVIDRLIELGHAPIDVQFAAKSPDPRYANMRAYIWGRMRDWLQFGAIPDEEDLKSDLKNQTYFFNNRNEEILTSKDDMREDGLASPDDADALAVTFAADVISRRMQEARAAQRPRPTQRQLDYNPLDAGRE